jgi:WD40 repeat protein
MGVVWIIVDAGAGVRDVGWSPCGKYVVMGSFDSQISLWEVRNGGRDAKLMSVVEGH